MQLKVSQLLPKLSWTAAEASDAFDSTPRGETHLAVTRPLSPGLVTNSNIPFYLFTIKDYHRKVYIFCKERNIKDCASCLLRTSAPCVIENNILHERISFFNNQMVGKTLVPEAFKVRSNMGIKYIGVVQGHPEGVST